MVKKRYLAILLVFCFAFLFAQSLWAQHMYGTVSDDGSSLEFVVLTNLNSGNGSVSDEKGLYRLSCRAGDSIKVSLVGYIDVILQVPKDLKGDYFRNINLKPMAYMLESVEVSALTPYQRDSIARRNLYGPALSREWVSGPKAIFSPMTFLAQKVSKKAKQRRAFQLNYGDWENERFIESRYTKELVGTVVPLTGDTLSYFMNAYPIAPDFARAATDLELRMWIKYNYLEWLKKPEIPVFTSPKKKK